jgi:hypothetical protein
MPAPAFVLSLVAVTLFLSMLVCAQIGRRIGIAGRLRDPEGVDRGIASVETAVFALLGLLIAFTFSGAASRFEDRRHLITVEANAIGTAWLRLDLLPPETQGELRALFRTYLDSRLATYQHVESGAQTRAQLDRSAALQGEIWTKALAATRKPEVPSSATMLMIPALNDMFDITTTRLMATRNHPPLIIFALLAGLSLVGAMLVGFDTSAGRARWLPAIVFAGIMALAVNVILELEFPRLGLIRVDGADAVLVELRASMR